MLLYSQLLFLWLPYTFLTVLPDIDNSFDVLYSALLLRISLYYCPCLHRHTVVSLVYLLVTTKLTYVYLYLINIKISEYITV